MDYEKVFKERILARCKREMPDMPSDAEVHLSAPDDGRLWVDILSAQYCEETDDSEIGAPPNGEPVFAQYILVSNELLQEKCPEFYKRYTED